MIGTTPLGEWGRGRGEESRSMTQISRHGCPSSLCYPLPPSSALRIAISTRYSPNTADKRTVKKAFAGAATITVRDLSGLFVPIVSPVPSWLAY